MKMTESLTFPKICNGNPIYASTVKVSNELEEAMLLLFGHTRTPFTGLQRRRLLNSLSVAVKRRIRTVLQLIYEAGD